MASAEEKAEKKELAEKERELRLAGVVPRQSNFNLDAGKRVYTAWAWIPRLKWVIVVSSAVSILSLLGVLYSVYSRPLPRVFLSLPDGTIACGPLSDSKGRPLKRSRDYQAMCDRLLPPVGLESSMDVPPVQSPATEEAPPASQVPVQNQVEQEPVAAPAQAAPVSQYSSPVGEPVPMAAPVIQG